MVDLGKKCLLFLYFEMEFVVHSPLFQDYWAKAGAEVPLYYNRFEVVG